MRIDDIVRRYADGRISTTETLAELRRRTDIPLSEGQRGLWALHRMEPDTYAYNVPICFSCDHIDSTALEGAFRDTISRHPVLSASVRAGQDGPYLSHGDSDSFQVEHADISDVPADEVLEYLRKRAQQPFDLAVGPLIRLCVLSRAESEVYVLLVIHHIVIDGASARLVLDTLFRAYHARLDGRELPFQSSSTSFGEFVSWENDALAGTRGELDRDFWRRELTGMTPLAGLPGQSTLMPDDPHAGEVHTLRLSQAQADAVASFTESHEITPGTFFLAIFTTLLHRYTGQQDIVIGMPVSGRPAERFDSVVGYFVNTLPIRSRPTPDDEFTELAARLQSTVFEAIEHAAYPFHRIVRDLGSRDASPRSPVYQVVFNYQNSALSGYLRERVEHFPFQLVDGLYQLGEYDLTLDVVPGDGFALNWKYHPGAFSADAVARMADHFVTLVEDVIASDGRAPIGRLAVLDDAERQLVVDEWNRTDADYPADRTCWDLFAQRADSTPDSPAVTCGNQTISYRELADRGTALADALQGQGVAAGDVVGVCFERSLDLVVSLLAVMKVGATYLPLDVDLPAERLSYMIEDSGTGLIVCHEAVLATLAEVDTHGARLHPIDRPAERGARAESVHGPGAAYVIYTSGSTGKPKGVVVPHRALTNFLLAMAQTLGTTSADRLLAVTTHSFDIAALELFLPLITGGQVCVCDAATAADATRLVEKIADWRPTMMQATPATWAMLVRVGWRNTEGVRILCGGEALPDNLKDRLVSLGEAWNLYGPTETTIWSTAKRLHPGEPVTVGRPIANTQVYVLDPNLQPVPVGVTGELYISGDGVALGYHGRPDLTAERFLDNPFVPGRRMYRTGDLARWLPDGEITLLGRLDNQVKLRGYRIELGEIEAALNTHPAVARGVVVVERTGRTGRLAAYYTRDGDASEAALRAHLARTLPAYMVPAAFVALTEFPLTTNGKIDRTRLSDPNQRAATEVVAPGAMAPAAGVERTVRRIFTDVLGVQDIDRDAGFFDIGGDSFTAIDVVTAINSAFGSSLRPTSLFVHSSVAAMARHLAELTPVHPTPTPKPRPAVGARPHSSTTVGEDAYLDHSIAIIGISCRFPGAADHREFWRDLLDGRSGSTSWSPEELRALGVPDDLITRPGYVPQRSVVDGRAEFDAAFFGISPRDAELMDPQARLLLQHAWQALEDAGYRPEDVPDTSVITATSTNFYQALLPNLMANAAGTRVLASAEVYTAWLLAQGGSVPTMISTKLGLRGPSMAVSTNCSSALSAVHLACKGLLTGEVDQALAGAASLFSSGELGYVHQPGLNFASDGRSRAFADGADGMSGGEGVGVVVLKRARDAIADGDHIYCVIRGIAVNNDGGDKAGFYAPSLRGQAEVIRKALDASGVDPATISYVEAHGTGTALGDPIEVAALTEAYRRHTTRTGYCGIGSVKSNIGHLDAAAGIAGLIKMALALRHGVVPRTLHADVPSTEMNWADSPFFVANENLPLDGAARVGLSSFGIGGTNVHAVLEQAPPGVPAQPSPGPHAVILSARDDQRLAVAARRLAEFLPEYRATGGDLASLAYTLQVGRRAMARRVAFVADRLDGLIAQVGAYVDGRVAGPVFGDTVFGDTVFGDTVFEGTVFEGTVRGPDDELVGLFSRTEQLRELAAEWLARGEWDKVAPLWVSGVDVDWRGYHGANPPSRVSLPTYPFDTRRFWPAAEPPPTPGPKPTPGPTPTPGPGPVEHRTPTTAPAGATEDMDAVLRRLVLARLVAIGLFREPVRHDRVDPDGVIAPGHARWLDHTVTVLLDGGELVRDGEFVLPWNGLPDLDRAMRDWREWTAAHGDEPDAAAKASLTEHMLESLPAILTGQTPATRVMFPGGSFEHVEPVYRGNPTADYVNAVTAGAVRTEVAVRPRGVRVLEIGAGVGSTSEHVFAQLNGTDIAEYCYTDISKAFLVNAERRFADRVPYLTFRVFDVERDPVEQGLTAGGYDIVIANNVLHATRDIVATVRHAGTLLRPGGVLLLNELTRNEWWSHLTFGLLDGWWRQVDGRRLEGGPALSTQAWRDVLLECGFEAVEQLAEPARALGQQVVLARAGSVARRAEQPGSREQHVRDAIEQVLMESLKLRGDELAEDQPFADYGLDSLTGVNAIGMLNESLGTDLDPSVLFENPSIRRLTRHILDEHGDTITAAAPPHTTESTVKSSTVDMPAPVQTPHRGREPVAIIGMSGRFPGARDVDEFWDLLTSGRDAVTSVSRWDVSSLGGQCTDGGFMDGIDEFDPLFFGISGAEATYMEPQQRLFLQEAWRALEDAGHAGESIDRDRCGIYVGCAAGDYLDLAVPSDYPAQAFWGNMNSLVPARIAYYLDLHGPTMAVDTACSSSLVSVYLACQGLWAGETDLAIAGGVYVQNSPRLYLAGSRAGMLSPTGRCHSFDQSADGFVPAEGVGALVLKRLSDAEADGDHIHGVIRGIGTNQDGTTNGITAPNGIAQERLIRQVYQDFEIDPAGIGLIEAHGTGTKLGDPVEFRALDRAFRAFTSRQGFCSLGSSKAVIGHAQAAAGVIGIIKAVLAIQHGVLPGLPHHRQTNSSITLAGSPFFVHTEPRQWAGDTRRAAITSLGASGTNAHAVIEQAPTPPPRGSTAEPRLIAVSALTEQALREQVARLARHCQEHPDLDLGDVSYTLLCGRRHLPHRWARVVRDVAELERDLTAWQSGVDTPATGTGRAPVLAAEFLDGGTPQVGELFRDRRYRRVPLPSYPFERERYRLPLEAAAVGDRAPDRDTLTGDEFYLRDHRVRGAAIAPGAMYLHWAAAAAGRTGDLVRLQDIVFLRPLTVRQEPLRLRVALRDGTRFEVSSIGSTVDEPVPHCQGEISTVDTPGQTLDLAAMLRDFRPTAIDPERFYADYSDLGIDYGPALRGLVSVHQGDGAVLARLRLPDVVADTVGDFAPHPTMVDSAMQCMRLLDDSGGAVGLVFAIRSAEVLAPCTASMWAWVRHDAQGTGIDIDLADANGTVCLRLRGIVGRRAERAQDAPVDAVTLLPVWDPVPGPEPEPWPRTSETVGILAATNDARDALTARYPTAHVLTEIAAAPTLDHLIWVAPGARENPSGDGIVDGQSAGTHEVFRTVKALLAAGYGDRPLDLTMITQRAHPVREADPVDPTHAGVAGMAGSIAKEYPNWRVRVSDVDAYHREALAEALSLPPDPDGNLRIRRDGQWYQQQLMTVAPTEPASSRLREEGTYVIVGGAGGLGTAISEYLIRRYRARAVWLGRRPLDARIEAAMATAASSGGPAPLYLRADATDTESLRAARAEIVGRFGAVHGVIHSGLVFSGASLARMTEAEFEEVLRGKVDTSARLLEVFGGDSLDFALFLSSINSYLKAITQANYAAACTFLDSFGLTVQHRHDIRGGVPGKVLNLGYCFNNAPADGGPGRGAVVSADAPLIQPDELAAGIELLCASPVSQLTLMKFGPALNIRGITVGDDEITLQAAALPSAIDDPEPTAIPTEDLAEDLARLRARTAELTALAI